MKLFRSNFTFYITILAVVILLIIFHYFRLIKPLESLFFTITKPFQYVAVKVFNGISDFLHVINSIRKLSKENYNLKIENERLLSENTVLKEIKKENEILREQFGFTKRKEFKLEPSFITSRDPSGFIQFVMIDKGERNGIKKDMSVIVSGGLLVGKVVEVYSNSSKVMLIVDSSSSVNAIVQDTEATGIVKGEHGTGLIMDTIPQNEVIKKDDLVITSGLGGNFPNGLVIGRVEDVKSSPNELFQVARVRPEVNFKKLKMVFVIIDY